MNKVLNYIGLAKRAKRIVLGTDSTIKMMQKNKVKFLFVASDASTATKDKLVNKAFFYNIAVNLDFTQEELSNALGVLSIKIVGILDDGFKNMIQRELERDGD